MERGKFIVLEGINGCGKGAQLFALASFLYGLSRASLVFVTREPNELDESGRNARKMLASGSSPYENKLAAVEFFAKNRAVHNGLVGRLVETGVYVVSDRYWHSNFAFQHAQGVPYEYIAEQNKRFRVPDLTLILDVPVDTAFARLDKRDGAKRRKFDSQKDFVEKVRLNYLELSKILPGLVGDRSIAVVDGTASIGDVSAKIIYECRRKFWGV
jgi:dTMP kinase